MKNKIKNMNNLHHLWLLSIFHRGKFKTQTSKGLKTTSKRFPVSVIHTIRCWPRWRWAEVLVLFSSKYKGANSISDTWRMLMVLEESEKTDSSVMSCVVYSFFIWFASVFYIFFPNKSVQIACPTLSSSLNSAFVLCQSHFHPLPWYQKEALFLRQAEKLNCTYFVYVRCLNKLWEKWNKACLVFQKKMLSRIPCFGALGNINMDYSLSTSR